MPHRLCRTCTASLQVHALCLLQPRPLLPQRTRRRLPEVQEQPGSVGSMRMTPQVQRGVAGGLGRRATLLQGRVVTGLPATTEHWPCKRRIRAGPHRKANTVKRGWGSGNAGSANWLNCLPCCPFQLFPSLRGLLACVYELVTTPLTRPVILTLSEAGSMYDWHVPLISRETSPATPISHSYVWPSTSGGNQVCGWFVSAAVTVGRAGALIGQAMRAALLHHTAAAR